MMTEVVVIVKRSTQIASNRECESESECEGSGSASVRVRRRRVCVRECEAELTNEKAWVISSRWL